MVKAIYTLKNGKPGKMYARDFDDLFQKLDLSTVSDIYAVVITSEDIRQGLQME